MTFSGGSEDPAATPHPDGRRGKRSKRRAQVRRGLRIEPRARSGAERCQAGRGRRARSISWPCTRRGTRAERRRSRERISIRFRLSLVATRWSELTPGLAGTRSVGRTRELRRGKLCCAQSGTSVRHISAFEQFPFSASIPLHGVRGRGAVRGPGDAGGDPGAPPRLPRRRVVGGGRAPREPSAPAVAGPHALTHPGGRKYCRRVSGAERRASRGRRTAPTATRSWRAARGGSRAPALRSAPRCGAPRAHPAPRG